jgi:Lipid A 3-O-deacylase (PagL)
VAAVRTARNHHYRFRGFPMRHAIAAALALATAALCVPPARADDINRWFSVGGGTGEHVNTLHLGFAWQPECCAWLSYIRAEPLVQANVEYMNSLGRQSRNDVVWNFTGMGGMRWRLAPASSLNPHIDLGLGGAVFTRTSIGDRDLGSVLSFAERLSAGIALEPTNRYQLAIFAEHRSNAGISPPNQGVTTFGLEFLVGWQ